MPIDLTKYGWNECWQEHMNAYAREGLKAGRIVLEHKHMYRIATESGEVLAEVSGKMRHQATGRDHYPAVGDWVALELHDGGMRAIVRDIFPRISKFSRKAAGFTTDEQIVAANVDTVFLVNSLNRDFNLRRIERYLLLAWESGANPVIVLSKADLCADAEQKRHEVQGAAIGVPVCIVSSYTGQGMEELSSYIGPGKTAALLGSSGAGKSSLINLLLGDEVQKVHDIREDDDRGRHTTTHRELFVLPQGGLVIDTPGMRELQLWHGDDGLSGTFDDIERLASECRFSDCKHEKEPHCAVQRALQLGELDRARLHSYKRMKRELAYLEARDQDRVRQLEKARGKKHAQFLK